MSCPADASSPVSPGSSEAAYALAGVPFGERWPRFDQASEPLAPGSTAARSRAGTTGWVPRSSPGPPEWATRRCGSAVGVGIAAVLTEWLAPVIRRPVDVLRERLPFGVAAAAPDLVSSFRDAGVPWSLVRPVGDGAADDIQQLHRFHDEVIVPLGG